MTDTYAWKGGSGAFSDALEWSLESNPHVHAVPGTSDIADFAKSGVVSGPGDVYQVTVEASLTVEGSIMASDIVDGIEVTGNLTVASSGSLDVTDIVSGNSKLKFESGSIVDTGGGANGLPYGQVGLSAGGGTVLFDDDTFNSTGLIAIGNSADGLANSGVATATVENGATVTASYTGLGGAGGFSSTQSDKGTLILKGNGTTWSNDATTGQGLPGSMIVGVEGKGILTIEDGAVMTDATEGYVAGVSSSVKITGSGSKWSNDGYVDVAVFGSGRVTVEDSGSLESAGGYIGDASLSTGAVTIENGGDWSDSLWLTVGNSGTGTLLIKDGGSTSVGASLNHADSASLYVGDQTGSKGIVTVTGVGSDLTVDGQALVGISAAGALVVSDGASLTAGDTSGQTAGGLVIAYNAGYAGHVTVTGAGSSLVNEGVLGVGAGGSGTLTISDGGSVTTNINQALGYQGLYAGAETGSIGVIDVTGANSTLTVDTYAIIGSSGHGAINVSAGGAVSIGDDLDLQNYAALLLGDAKGSKGTFSIDAGTLDINGQTYVGVSGGASLTISGGGTATTGDAGNGTSSGFTIGYLTGSNGAVTITGAASTLTNQGIFVVAGEGKGSLTVNGGAVVKTDLSSTYTYDGVDVGQAKGSTGSIMVNASGSLFSVGTNLVVGQYGKGSLTDSDDATISVDGDTTIGQLTKSSGTGLVESGALLSVGGDEILGYDAGSTGTLTVTGIADINGKNVASTLQFSGYLTVGDVGKGTLDVEAGAVVKGESPNGALFAGYFKGSTGVIDVDGAGSELSGASLNLGDMGRSTLTISSEGLVSVTGEASVGKLSSILLSGGSLDAGSIVFTGAGSLSGDGTVQANTLQGGTITDSGGELLIDAAISGKASLTVDAGDVLSINGAVAKTAHLNFGAGGDRMDFYDGASIGAAFQNMGTGDAIDLLGLKVVGHGFHSGTGDITYSLTFSDGAKGKLTFDGSYSSSEFQFKSDGANGTLIAFV